MANYVDKISLNGNTADIIGASNDGYYPGVDLSVKHAEEIAGYDSVWSWIKARITAGNFSQLHVGDYIPFSANNLTFQAQIAGINPYKGYGDAEVGNHIDFISRELWPTAFKMNLVNFNNGISDSVQSPWLASNGYHFVNSKAGSVPNSDTVPVTLTDVDYTSGGMYYYLPDALKNVIVEKRVFAQTRYNASSKLNSDNSATWLNFGKLWLPDEFEVTGAKLMSTTGWTSGGFIQYPLFAGNMNRAKKTAGSSTRYSWWLSSAGTGNSTYFVYVTSAGSITSYYASTELRAPFCFRISG